MSFKHLNMAERYEYNTSLIAADKSQLPYIVGEAKYGFRCALCFNEMPLTACHSCGGKAFIPENVNGEFGLKCVNCKQGFARCNCEICETSNKVYKTFGKPESDGCAEMLLFSSSLVILFVLTTAVAAKAIIDKIFGY